jgi:polyribonucleotide nucleotidyltransferase
MIRAHKELEIGRVYSGRWSRSWTSGAFVDFPSGESLVHISQLSNDRVKNVRDVVKEGTRLS